jgi:hypothetical protein
MRTSTRLTVAFSIAGIVALAANANGHTAAAATARSSSAIHTMATLHGAHGTSRPQRTSNLTYQGGPVEVTPTVYISWWGPQWSSPGFITGGYSSAQAQTYVTGFFNNVGGSPWDGINTQYCQGVATGTVDCLSNATHIGNPQGQLAGTWNDPTTVPASPTQSDIAAAAVRLQTRVGYYANATYMVFTPTGHSMNGFATSWCAWHSVTSSSSGAVAYAYMPYQPDAGASCGENFVNSTNNNFGNGYFDGFSVVGGHEYAEALTDPITASGSYAWYDSRGSENGDKCAWNAASANITLGSHQYAVQPLWSNTASRCAI